MVTEVVPAEQIALEAETFLAAVVEAEMPSEAARGDTTVRALAAAAIEELQVWDLEAGDVALVAAVAAEDRRAM